MFVDLPVGEPNPALRLGAVIETTRALKESEQSLAASTLLDASQFAAPNVLSLAARLVQHQPFVNLVVTNVPGPPVPLYCLGAPLREAYPMVPLSRNLSLGVAILSYCGSLHVGLLADADTWPDLRELGADLDAAVAELRQDGVRIDLDEGAAG
jgi:hypothetical protein